MTDSPNVAATKRFGELVNTGQFDAFDEVVAAGCVDNDPAPDQGPGPEGFKTFFTAMRTAFPDMKVEPQTMVTEGDQVAFAYTLTGTHKGTSTASPRPENRLRCAGCRSVASRTARWSNAGVAPTNSAS